MAAEKICPRCKNPHTTGQSYCRPCVNAYKRENYAKANHEPEVQATIEWDHKLGFQWSQVPLIRQEA